MALQLYYFDSVGAGTRADLLTIDDAFVAMGTTVGSTDATAIYGSGSDHFVQVSGNVYGHSGGIFLGNSLATDFRERVVINAGGYVGSANTAAIQFMANESTIVNAGMVSGRYGILFGGVGIGQSTLHNSGTITGELDAILRDINSAETLVITNTGEIIAGNGNDTNAFDSNGVTATDIIQNRGSIIGDIMTEGGIDTVDNRGGMIVGDVFLGADNDVYDGRGGTIDGTVFGEDGNDIFYAGASAETFNGGAGTDTLNVSSSAGGTIDLSGRATGTGVALGDIFTDIENVSGSLSGADIIIGSAASNVLFGFGGNDALNGGAGGDFLVGNAGNDTLVGGAGNDYFQYLALSESGDAILDYGNIAGNNDTFRISAAGFGGGLVAGALNPLFFQSRADNLAQDANDRFIFRTTDQTLWFDVNGNAAGGLTMIADLQAGAVLTAADIVLF